MDSEQGIISKDFLNTVLENLPFAVFAHDLDGNILIVNKISSQYTGYSKEELLNLKIKDIDPDSELRNDKEDIWLTLEKVKSKTIISKHIRKDKSEYQAEININYVLINNEPIIIATVNDITDKIKIQKQLENFKRAVEFSTNAVGMFTPDGKHWYQNKAFDELFGDIGDKHPSKLYVNEQIGREVFETLMSGKEWNGEVEMWSKKKKKLHILLRAYAIKDKMNKIEGLVGVHVDITDKKNAEEQLMLTQFGIDHSQISVFQVDENGNIYYANKYACNQLGYSFEEITKLKIYDIDPTLNKKKWVKHRGITRKNGVRTIESLHQRKDGTVFPVEVTVNYIEFKNQKVSFSFVKDISGRKKYEKDMIIAKEKAEESDRLKSAFLANVSHEIRTPMNGILGFAQLLIESKLSELQQNRYLELIQQSGNRMLNILNDLIDISKIESGQIEIKTETVDLENMLENLYEFFMPEAKHRKLEFSFKYNVLNENSVIKTDKVKLNQILSNLIKNALKYTNKGSVEFGVEIVQMKKMKPESFIEFYVKDTGIGIPVELREKIFERFRQGDLVYTKAIEGAGLGLSISKAYVEMLGGKIFLDSMNSNGSIFKFIIPYIPDEKRIILKSDVKSEKNKINKNILIAEDDDNSYLFLSEILTTVGATVYRANNGYEAIDFVLKNDLDIILMDIKMPELNGFETTQRIKKIKNIPVIAQTAFTSKEDQKKAKEAGCDDFIIKPINKDILISKISNLI